MEYLLRWLIHPKNAGPVLGLMLCVYYGCIIFINPDISDKVGVREQLPLLTVLSTLFLLAGWFLSPSALRQDDSPVENKLITKYISGIFFLFVLLTTLTAPSIPLLDAIAGQDVEDVAIARENFLKAREGFSAALPYVNGILTFTFVPYAMCSAILNRDRKGWVLLVLFLVYSMLFVEKAFFVRVLAPITALLVITNTRRIRLSWILLFTLSILAINIQLSGFVTDDRDLIQFFVYRLLEVPAQTAIDTLSYWNETWGSKLLWGASNMVLSFLFWQERVQLERLVFEYQFGAFETGTGSANSVFFIDAYVNFGVVGLALTSAFAGAILKFVAHSRDLAIRCLSPLLIYTLFFGSFYAIFFGNGLLLFLLFSTQLSYQARASTTGGERPLGILDSIKYAMSAAFKRGSASSVD